MKFSVVYAARQTGDGLIIEDTVTGDPVLTGADLPLAWAPGIDASVAVELGEFDMFARFLGGFSFSASTEQLTPALWNFPTDPPLFGFGSGELAVANTTALNTLEVGVTRAAGPLNLFAGVRGMMIEDHLLMLADFGVASAATVALDAETTGIGPQVGGSLRVGDEFHIDLDGRLAALLTRSHLDFEVEQEVGPSFAASSEKSGAAFLAEAGIAVGTQVGESAALQLGYRGIFVHNVPTALSNLETVNVLDGTLDGTSESFWIHGVTLGLEGRF